MSRSTTASTRCSRDDPAPQEMADVRRERVDPVLLAVERERVEAAALLAPERLVEALAQLGRLALEPVGQVAVAPDLARQLGHPQLRVVDVALHLARRDRPGRLAPVVEELGVVGVLPGLVLEPALRPPVVLDEPVAVEVAVLVDPVQRAHGRLAQRRARTRRRPSSATPPRGGRGRAASRRPCRSSAGTRSSRPCRCGPRGRSCPARRRWTDRPRCAWSVGERGQRVPRQLGPEDERLEARDQRVAAEHGHEPRHPGGEELALRAAARAGAARRGRRPSGRTWRGAAASSPGAAEPASARPVSDARTRSSSAPNRCSAPVSARRGCRRARRSRRRAAASARPGSSARR